MRRTEAIGSRLESATGFVSATGKAHTGEPPAAYLTRVRMARAKELLETSEVSIAEVAGRLGYADVASFRHRFSRQCGLSPSAYRKRYRLSP